MKDTLRVLKDAPNVGLPLRRKPAIVLTGVYVGPQSVFMMAP